MVITANIHQPPQFRPAVVLSAATNGHACSRDPTRVRTMPHRHNTPPGDKADQPRGELEVRTLAMPAHTAPGRCIGTFGLGFSALVPFPLASPARFSSSVRKPGLESRSLYTGHHMDSKQVSSMPLSRDWESAPVLMSIKNLTMRRQELACARLSSPYMTRPSPRLFHNVHHRGFAAEAAYGCLKPPPAGRLRRALLHLSYSTALACLHDTNSLGSS